MSDDDINNFIPSLLNPRAVRRNTGDITLTQNTVVSRCSLSLKRNGGFNSSQLRNKLLIQNKENTPIPTPKKQTKKKTIEELGNSIGFSAIEDLVDIFARKDNALSTLSSPFSYKANKPLLVNKFHNITELPKAEEKDTSIITILSGSSDTELYSNQSETCKQTCHESICKSDKPVVTLNIGFKNCENVDITTTNSNIKRISVSHKNDDLIIDCDIVENSQVSCLDSTPEKKVSKDSGFVDENMIPRSPKRSGVAVNLQIKKRKISSSQKHRLSSASTIEDVTENSNILILNTDAIEKVSHVIVQPPNYKLVKRKISHNSKFTTRKSASKSPAKNVIKLHCDTTRQKSITDYFKSDPNASTSTIVLEDLVNNGHVCDVTPGGDDTQAMNKTFGDNSILKSEQFLRLGSPAQNAPPFSRQRISTSAKQEFSPNRQNVRSVISDAQNACAASLSKQISPLRSPARKSKLDTIQVPIASSKAVKSHVKNVPLHKIVAGTHFAVDAFCYGDIPNVKHYFLTHFHSDHYSGLKKSFNKQLYCTRITADLCVSRLGVDPKVIHVIKLDETIQVDGIDVMPIDANHCPGAVMLIFTLPNQKSILHTGDFRASPVMESYPIFWNVDVHTIYLDTTYCNPRYDFPTQDQSLDMALYLLRQKKMALEKAGKKFSSVLIVCGTYTIGKEKFFMGMARRVGCNVWACPEKDRVLQSVEGRSFGHAPKHSCQLHVVPMRDLTVEKLNTYLESLQGAFSEVVAFKPSGWENGKNSTIEQNHIAIHGIPYSEHSSFSEMIRFVKFLKPKQVVPTVDISGGVKAVQKYFPCPLVAQDDASSQPRVTDYFSIQSRQPRAAVT